MLLIEKITVQINIMIVSGTTGIGMGCCSSTPFQGAQIGISKQVDEKRLRTHRTGKANTKLKFNPFTLHFFSIDFN